MISELDATGLRCPLPVLKAKKRLKDVPPGGTLRVLATDPDAVKDFEAFCAETGHAFVQWSRVGDVLTIDIAKPIGQRISDMTHLASGQAIDPAKSYVVAGWASVNEATEGPPIYDVVAGYIEKHKTVSVPGNQSIKVVS